MKPSKRIEQIYDQIRGDLHSNPKSALNFMTEDELIVSYAEIYMKSIVQYLDEQAEANGK